MWRAWTLDPWTIAGLTVLVVLYWRGARGLVGRVRGFRRGRVVAFGAAIAVLVVTIASPIDSLGHVLLWVHMVQHWLLMMVVAPLLLVGSPGIPLLRGLPTCLRRDALGPFLASPSVRRAFAALVHPMTGWMALAVTTWVWHIPALYERAIDAEWLHRLEHASFLGAAILFWWPIVNPWPWSRRWHGIALVLYLLAADVQNTVFAAVLSFAEHPIYGRYEATAPAMGMSALKDQHLAGAFMWTAGQLVVLPIVAALILRAVRGRARHELRSAFARDPQRGAHGRRMRFDLLRVRGVGWLFATRRVRECVRWVLVGAACVVAIDGFVGPVDAPSNLAGTIPWTHWRGLVVIVLLLGGNVACMTCPLIAPRRLARRWIRPRWSFPRGLRSKWLAATLIVGWLVTYEAFDLWASPLATAWLIVGYFVGAFVIDMLFAGGNFCKWVCPIGQLHASMSLVSPLSVSVRSPDTCAKCTTHECIRGASLTLNGCDLELFQPTKRGNADCTFCLDCADACPRANVGVLTQRMRRGLIDPSWGSSIGRIASRLDMAVLLGVLTGGAFTNALAMTGPWLALADAIAAPGWPLALAECTLSLGALFVVSGVAMGSAAWVSSRCGPASFVPTLCQGIHASVPIGVAMWAAHWLFHLGTSASTAVPVVQRVAEDLGITLLGEPAWSASCCGPMPSWLRPVQFLLVETGFLMSAWMVWRAAGTGRAWPWWTVQFALLCLAMWIILQPMQMRGTLLP